VFKKIMCFVLALLTISCGSIAFAAGDPTGILALAGQYREIGQRSDSLQQTISTLKARMKTENPDTVTVTGTVRSTNPYIVDGLGLSAQTLFGGVNVYHIKNPGNGIVLANTYTGNHVNLGTYYDKVRKEQYILLGPCTNAYYKALTQKIAAEKQADSLETQKGDDETQILNLAQSVIADLKQYQNNSTKDMVFQVGNPYYVAYGQGNIVDRDNYSACPTLLSGNTTMIPIRPLIEGMGGVVKYDSQTSTATCSVEDKTIVVTLGSNTAYVDGKAVKLSVAPRIISQKTMIPLRFVSEQLGAEVQWMDGGYIRVSHPFAWSDTQENQSLLANETVPANHHRVYDYAANISYIAPDYWKINMNTLQSDPSIHGCSISLRPVTVDCTAYSSGTTQLCNLQIVSEATGELYNGPMILKSTAIDQDVTSDTSIATHVCGIVDWDSDPDTLPSFKIYTNCGIVIRVSQEDDASGFASVIKDPAVSQGLQNDFFIMINSLQYIIGAVG